MKRLIWGIILLCLQIIIFIAASDAFITDSNAIDDGLLLFIGTFLLFPIFCPLGVTGFFLIIFGNLARRRQNSKYASSRNKHNGYYSSNNGNSNHFNRPPL